MGAQKVFVFIDTNIYLRFYDSKQSNFKKLLKSLEEIDKYIFITTQIINEIDRNKQDLFKRSFDGYINQSKLLNVELPEHISANMDEKIKDWNIKRKKMEGIGKSQTNKLQEISNDMLEEILKGEDDISKIINKISSDIDEPGNKLIKRAKKRKELGNPPGKKEDPIGDQLNWELLIGHISSENIEDLIIISADNDFFVVTNEKIQLNAKLYKELAEINNKINIYCYNTLVEGLKKFNELKEIKNLPNSEILEKIRIEEAESLNNRIVSSSFWSVPADPVAYSSFWATQPNLGRHFEPIWANPVAHSYENLTLKCPNCNQLAFIATTIKQKDGKSFRDYECKNCGFKQEIQTLF